MILELKITNFAIIENLSVAFHPGLNVLTGETGAGKSIVIDALNLILGGRADADSIRSSEDTATVEARLRVTQPETLALIHESGIDLDGEDVIIRRTISTKDKNRAFLNNCNLTVATLAAIGRRLVDIHGQHDHQNLLYPETHIDLLDAFGGLIPERDRFREQYARLQEQLQQWNRLNQKQSDRLQRQDLLAFQIREIDEADLQADEEDALRAEKNRLRHAESLHASVQEALELLADSEGSVQEKLKQAGHRLDGLPKIDPALEAQAGRSRTAYYEIEELIEELRDYLGSIEFSPERLEEIDDRLAEINGLKRKYGSDVTAILEYRASIGRELDTLNLGEEALDTLKAELRKMEKDVGARAAALAGQREKAAARLKKSIEKELRDLDMKRVQFGVRFDYPPDPEGFTTYQDARVRTHANGIGEIEFLFSPNPGEDLRPLARIASGGELSRVMLAIKTILNNQDGVPVMVFDEVDAGISGQVAEKVGYKLKQLARGKQVFCITHLPQIAGFADVHYRVQKTVTGKRTRSTIEELPYEERVEEIARLSGGTTITEATRRHAREMIQ